MPIVVPSRCTEAYGTGSFVAASVTFPDTVTERSCADAAAVVRTASIVKICFILTFINNYTYGYPSRICPLLGAVSRLSIRVRLLKAFIVPKE